MAKPIGKKQLTEMAAMISNPYFDTFRPSLKKYLRLSRSKTFTSKPEHHVALQLAILMALEEGDDAIRKGKALVTNKSDPQHVQNLRNQFLNMAFKAIADGIAWRTLDFNRFHIRILSQARSPGATDGKVGRKAETTMAKRVAETGDFVIINDTTNILRVGDLVLIKPDKKPHHLYLAEMKLKKGKLGMTTIKSIKQKYDAGKGVSKQEKRLWQAQQALATNIFTMAGRKVPVLEIEPGKASNHMRKVNNLLVKANKEGAAEGFVAPYMYVSALDLTYFNKGTMYDLEGTKAPKDLQPLIMWSSYDTLSILREREVARSSAPYTVFPFSVSNVTKLNLGEMLLQVVIYKQPLTYEFKRLGWDLIFDEDELDAYDADNDEDMVSHFSSETLFPDEGFKGNRIIWLAHPGNGFKWPIHQFIVQMMHEYISAEYIVAIVKEIMYASTPGKMNGFYVVDNNDIDRWK